MFEEKLGDSFTPLVDLKDILYTISYITNLRMRTSKTTKLKHNKQPTKSFEIIRGRKAKGNDAELILPRYLWKLF